MSTASNFQKMPDPYAEGKRRDAETLEMAVQVLKRRSTRPNGFWLGVLCKTLLSVAQELRMFA